MFKALPQVDIAGYKPILEERAKVLEKHFGRKIVCEIEPGWRFVARCGYLIGEVRSLNHTCDETGKRLDYVLGNIGFCHLIRPMAYGSYHPIWFDGDNLGPVQDVIVAGAGAYGFAMSSNYNTQPLIAEVLVDGDQCALARRRQTLDDVVREEL